MNKESIELITHICRDGVWAKEYDMDVEQKKELDKILDSDLGKFFKPLTGFCMIGKKFSTAEECENYAGAIEEIRGICIKININTCAGGMGSEGHLFGGSLQAGNMFFINVDRKYLFSLASQTWAWSGRFGDFVDYMNRNNGIHWDELKRSEIQG